MLEAKITEGLTFAIISHCLFSIVYLSTYQWKRNMWLVLLFASMLLTHVGLYIGHDKLSTVQSIFIGNPGVLLFIIPGLYLFTRELVMVGERTRTIFIHFIPGVVFHLLYLYVGIPHPKDLISGLADGHYITVPAAFLLTFFITAIYYGYEMLKIISINQRKYQNEYADTSTYLTLDWLKYTIWAFLLNSFIGLLLFPASALIANFALPFVVIELLFLLSIMYISYFAYRQPTLYQSLEVESIEVAKPPETNVKPLMTDAQIQTLSQQIEEYFVNSQPFLNQNVRMPDIAKALNIKPNSLSWYLNEHHQMNFFTFVNQYRVKYAAERLVDEEYGHYTLEAISKLSGFNSKTTFNNRFKEMMGVTPSVYRRERVE